MHLLQSPACLSPVGDQMLPSGANVCCRFFCGIFPFQYRCRGGFFLLLVVPPTPHFLLLHPMQMSSNMTALKITSGRSASCSDGTRAARRVHAFQLDETCWSFPGVSPHRLFLEMAHRTCCATISACCWALHFFPCMVMRLLRCLPFSWRGRWISLILLTTCRSAPCGLLSCVFCIQSKGNSLVCGH